MEYGMAAEPSALGSKIKFWQDNTPSEYHTLFHIEDIAEFPEYEVENDAFMALTLHRIRMERQRIGGQFFLCGRIDATEFGHVVDSNYLPPAGNCPEEFHGLSSCPAWFCRTEAIRRNPCGREAPTPFGAATCGNG